MLYQVIDAATYAVGWVAGFVVGVVLVVTGTPLPDVPRKAGRIVWGWWTDEK